MYLKDKIMHSFNDVGTMFYLNHYDCHNDWEYWFMVSLVLSNNNCSSVVDVVL